MAYVHTDLLAAARAHCKITSDVTSDVDALIIAKDALARLHADVPRRKSVRITGTGANFVDLSAVATDWVDGASRIVRIIKSPVIADDEEISILEPGLDYETYDEDGNDYVRFASAIASTDAWTMEYSVPWTVSGVDGASSTTVPAHLQPALNFLLAALLCYGEAARAAGTRSGKRYADVIEYGSGTTSWTKAGMNWEIKYNQAIGRNEGKPAAASRRAFPQQSTVTGRSRLTH